MRTARTLSESTDALTGLGEELAFAGRQLERKVRTERRWQAIVPGLVGAGGIALGAAGGLPGIAAGALGAISSLVPYRAALAERRRNAAYLFFIANRAKR
ncbi:hypothetical protein [Phytohabitans rumicis]|nr:hypothetical protein [Phytohabitans rumicis]